MRKKLKFDHTNKMFYVQPGICRGESHTQTPMGLWHTNESPNLGQKTRSYSNLKKERTCKIVDFVVPAYHKIKLKESEKKDKNLDLAMEHEGDNCNSCDRCFGTVTKWLLKGMRDLVVGWRVETIQTTALLGTARILRRVLETWGDFSSLRLQRKTISYRLCEKL